MAKQSHLNTSLKNNFKKGKEKKAAHSSRHNTINSKHNQQQCLHFTYLQLRKVWTGVFSFVDHFSTKLKRLNYIYLTVINRDMFGSQYICSTGTQLHWTACDDKQLCHVKRHCTEKYKLNPLAILNKAIYFNQLATISHRFHLISNNNNTDVHSKMTPPFFSKVTDMTHIQNCQ